MSSPSAHSGRAGWGICISKYSFVVLKKREKEIMRIQEMKNKWNQIEVRHKWDIGCWVFAIVYTIIAVVLAFRASQIWENVSVSYWVGIAIASVFAIGGILWQLHSSALLREVWKQEKRGIKDYKHYKELVEVDRMWASILFVIAALIFTLIAFVHSFLGS